MFCRDRSRKAGDVAPTRDNRGETSVTNQRGRGKKITGFKPSHWKNPALAEHFYLICFFLHEQRQEV